MKTNDVITVELKVVYFEEGWTRYEGELYKCEVTLAYGSWSALI